MDEELVDDTAQVAVAEGSQQRRGREDDFAVTAESRKILKSREIRIPSNEDRDAIQRGESVVKAVGYAAASQHPRMSLFMDDADLMVEELTVKGYNGSSLDIGTSNNREQMYNNRPNHWQNPSQVVRDSGVENSPNDVGHRKNVQGMSSAREDIGPASFPELLVRKSLSDGQGSSMEHQVAGVNTEGASNVHGGMRTKIISKSGFTEYFIKNTLKGKGVVCKGPSRDQNQIKTGIGTDQNQMKPGAGSDQIQVKTGVGRDLSQMKSVGTRLNSDVSLNHSLKPANSPTYSVTVPRSGKSDNHGVTLREWLKTGNCRASKVERLNIFRKIVDLVDDSHSHGIALPSLFPSYIKLLPSNQVEYLGLPVQKQMLDTVVNSEVLHLDNSFIGKRLPGQGMFHSLDMRPKKQKLNEDVRVTRSDLCLETARDSKVNALGSQGYCNEYEEDIQFSKHNTGKTSAGISHFFNAGQLPSTTLCERFEYKWYRSLEGGCTTSSNIYCLGVLLFELLGHFDSERAHIAAMSDLQHRILPPVFLSENPKEAGFCLWLLHPEPSSRPSTREILQSEVINGLQELYSEDLLSSIDQDDAESELLLHFLITSEERKQKDAFKLAEEIRCLESDIEEVKKRHDSRKSLVSSSLQNDCSSQNEIMPVKKEPCLEMLPSIPPISIENESRLIRNICHLESAYFSMRSKVHLSETETATHPDKDLLRNRESWSVVQKGEGQNKRKDTLGTFFDGLCKYARYSKFEVRGVLRNTDFNNPANVTCSLSFDRDEDYFASAGISKKIKIFDFSALCNDSVDIHYPVVEMSNRSKLSCVCWNNYIKNYLASTDYDGVVKLWDASTGQELSPFTEHEKRAWSVDFSPACPTKLASGSDDCSVKLWSISERNSLGTIRNVANVCCVQFSAHSSHLLAFGSVDSSTYCYDLRNLRSPWCVLAGHRKAVSYVKFLDSETLVSASTDNTLKIWDLNKSSPVDLSANACSLTLSGHTNEKNFVGLSVADGYIVCGSETNEIYTYYRSLPMPITSHKFGSVDPISGKDTDDDNGQFVSSVCWKGKSDMLIAANSSGFIKLLQMV